MKVLWGFLNIVAGYVLICRVGNFELKGMAVECGVLPMSLLHAHLFGPLHGDRPPGDR